MNWASSNMPILGWIYYNITYNSGQCITLSELMDKPGTKLVGPNGELIVKTDDKEEVYTYNPIYDRYIKCLLLNYIYKNQK